MEKKFCEVSNLVEAGDATGKTVTSYTALRYDILEDGSAKILSYQVGGDVNSVEGTLTPEEAVAKEKTQCDADIEVVYSPTMLVSSAEAGSEAFEAGYVSSEALQTHLSPVQG